MTLPISTLSPAHTAMSQPPQSHSSPEPEKQIELI
jgi:hypothetical protein